MHLDFVTCEWWIIVAFPNSWNCICGKDLIYLWYHWPGCCGVCNLNLRMLRVDINDYKQIFYCQESTTKVHVDRVPLVLEVRETSEEGLDDLSSSSRHNQFSGTIISHATTSSCLYKALMTFMEHCYGYGSLMGWVWHHYVITKENDICILAYCYAIRLWFCQITATLLDRLLQVHSQEMFPTGLCWSSPRDVCFFIFGCLFNLLIRHGFVYSTGDEEVVVILSFSHVSQLHSDRHVERGNQRGFKHLVCVLLRNHTLEVVYSTIQYLQVVSTSYCQKSTELDGNL